MAPMDNYFYSIDALKQGDPDEISMVHEAMARGGEHVESFKRLEDILQGSSREVKFVEYLNKLRGGVGEGRPPTPKRPGAAAAPSPGGTDLTGRKGWTSSSGEKRKRKREEEKEDKELKKQDKKKRRKKRKQSSSDSPSSSSSSDSEEERERRKRRKRKDKKRRERKERERRRKAKKGKGESSSSSEGSDSASEEQSKKKPKIHLTKDRSPEPRDKRSAQYFIRNACKLYFPEWADWNELKKEKELMKTFQRDVRQNWTNGDSISEGYIYKQAQRILKDHRYQLKLKVKGCWDKKEKEYKKPEGMDEKVFGTIVKSLSAAPGTPTALRAHQGDAGARSDKRKMGVTNVWGQGGYP